MSFSKKDALVLFLISLISISNYAIINSPGSLQLRLIKVFNLSNFQYGVVFSLCSWVSLLDVVHGYLMDRCMGFVTATIIYSLSFSLGCLLYAIAGFNKSYCLLVAGRTLAGLGLNPIILMMNVQIIAYFADGKYLNLAYAIGESVFWFGSSAVYFVAVHVLIAIRKTTPNIEDAFAITNCIEMVIFGVLFIVPTIVMTFITKQKELEKDAMLTELTSSAASSSSTKSTTEMTNLMFKDYITLPIIFWIFSISTFLYYTVVTSFISMSLAYFEEKYGYESADAGILCGIITLVGALLSPLYSFFLDKFGHNLTSFTCAILFNILSLAVFSFTSWNAYIPAMLMSISIMLSTSVWAQFQFLVNEQQFTLGYGIAQTGLHCAQAVGNILSGVIVDRYGYYGFMISLFICAFGAALTITWVWIIESKRGFFLNYRTADKNAVMGRIK